MFSETTLTKVHKLLDVNPIIPRSKTSFCSSCNIKLTEYNVMLFINLAITAPKSEKLQQKSI